MPGPLLVYTAPLWGLHEDAVSRVNCAERALPLGWLYPRWAHSLPRGI